MFIITYCEFMDCRYFEHLYVIWFKHKYSMIRTHLHQIFALLRWSIIIFTYQSHATIFNIRLLSTWYHPGLRINKAASSSAGSSLWHHFCSVRPAARGWKDKDVRKFLLHTQSSPTRKSFFYQKYSIKCQSNRKL